MEYRYVIPGNPVTKKNSQDICINRKTMRPFIRPSKNFEAFENTALYYLQPKPEFPILEPVNVQCIYYMQTRRTVDLSNLLAATNDILVTARILQDDNRNIVAGHDGSRVFWDKEHPRTEIIITTMDSYTAWEPGRKKRKGAKP